MKLFSVFRKDLLTLMRNRAEMAVLFLMPLAFILPISFALGAGDGYGINRGNQMIVLPVVNYDGGPHAQNLMATVGESLRLEVGYEAEQIQALGLAGEEACGPVFGIFPAGVDEQATASPPSSESTAGGPLPTDENLAETVYPADDITAETVYPSAEDLEETVYPAEIMPTAASPTAASSGGAAGLTPTAPSGEGETRLTVAQSIAACHEIAARALLGRSARSAALIIPVGFSTAVDGGEQVMVTLIYDPAGDPVELQQIEGVIQGAAVKISLENQVGRGLSQLNDLVALAPAAVRQTWQDQNAQPPVEAQNPALSLAKVSPESYQFVSTPDTYQQTVPGYTVMYVFFIITAMTGSIRAEKLNGTFRRLLSAPIGRGELAAGKLLASFLIGFVQVIFLFLVGAVVFKLGLGHDPLAFLILTGALVITAAALGLAAATTPLKGAGLAAPLIIAALLGGCMFPIDLMPPFLRSLSYFVPHSWALNGYLNLMVRGVGLQEVMPQIGALLGFALVFFLIAVWRFRFDD